MVYFPFRNADVGSSPVITATMRGFHNGSKTIKIKPGDNPVTIPLRPITPGKPLFSQISTHIHFREGVKKKFFLLTLQKNLVRNPPSL